MKFTPSITRAEIIAERDRALAAVRYGREHPTPGDTNPLPAVRPLPPKRRWWKPQPHVRHWRPKAG